MWFGCKIYKLWLEVSECIEGERSQSMAQARTGSAQMAGEGGVDQITEAAQPCQLPGLLGFQSLGSWCYPLSFFPPSGSLGEGCVARTDYSGFFFPPAWALLSADLGHLILVWWVCRRGV